MSFLRRHKPLRRYTPLRRKTPLRKVSARQKTILELDMLAKAVVIERDGKRCLRCGATDNLHSSHIFPKGKYPKLRFNIDNLKILCFDCHIGWWHQHPEEAGDWIQTAIPKERYDRLLKWVIYVDHSILDLKLIEEELQQLLKYYKQYGKTEGN